MGTEAQRAKGQDLRALSRGDALAADRDRHQLLQNGGKLEIAQLMAGHESGRTTGLYDRHSD